MHRPRSPASRTTASQVLATMSAGANNRESRHWPRCPCSAEFRRAISGPRTAGIWTRCRCQQQQTPETQREGKQTQGPEHLPMVRMWRLQMREGWQHSAWYDHQKRDWCMPTCKGSPLGTPERRLHGSGPGQLLAGVNGQPASTRGLRSPSHST